MLLSVGNCRNAKIVEAGDRVSPRKQGTDLGRGHKRIGRTLTDCPEWRRNGGKPLERSPKKTRRFQLLGMRLSGKGAPGNAVSVQFRQLRSNPKKSVVVSPLHPLAGAENSTWPPIIRPIDIRHHRTGIDLSAPHLLLRQYAIRKTLTQVPHLDWQLHRLH